MLLGFEDAYSRSGKYKEHPLKGLVQAIQIVIYFIGCIIIVAVLIDKSPSALLAGLGASAAVLMLVFKDIAVCIRQVIFFDYRHHIMPIFCNNKIM
jgi:miniconductance mechanosensitive channel